jgi:hypothetical protein
MTKSAESSAIPSDATPSAVQASVAPVSAPDSSSSASALPPAPAATFQFGLAATPATSVAASAVPAPVKSMLIDPAPGAASVT